MFRETIRIRVRSPPSKRHMSVAQISNSPADATTTLRFEHLPLLISVECCYHNTDEQNRDTPACMTGEGASAQILWKGHGRRRSVHRAAPWSTECTDVYTDCGLP